MEANIPVNVTISALATIGALLQGVGHFAGIIRDPDGTERALFLSEHPVFLARWGEYGQTVEGADSPSDGPANTRAMLAAGCALAVKAHEIDPTCHIPSRRENAIIEANLPHLVEAGWYWSSTQYSADLAWVQDCEDGYAGIINKDGEFRCRLVRSFPLQSFDPSSLPAVAADKAAA